MARTVPNLGWKDDDSPNRAGQILFREVGADAAYLLYGSIWWAVRFLDPADKWHVDIFGHRREQQPWRRELEVVAAGRTLDECSFYVRGGRARAMVGHGFTPIRGPDGEWQGFTDSSGARFAVGVPLVKG